jgi:hypothetical protein
VHRAEHDADVLARARVDRRARADSTLVLTALALVQVTGGGEAAAFEGWALVALYVVLSALTLYE